VVQRASFSGKSVQKAAPAMQAAGVTVSVPSNQQQAATQAAVFAGLATWGLLQVCANERAASGKTTLPLRFGSCFILLYLTCPCGCPLRFCGTCSGSDHQLFCQAVFESPDAQLADTAGLQMALALGYSVYTMKENKKMDLGESSAVAVITNAA
jgi:hypothetical protein